MRSTGLTTSLLLVLFLAGCGGKPEAPGYGNPFDPNGDDPGGAYGLTATAEGDSIVLRWTDLDAIGSYSVFHSIVSSDFSDMTAATPISEVRRSGGRATAVHRGFRAETVNHYRVQGTTSAPLIVSRPATIDVPVTVVLDGGGDTTPTRFVRLRVRTGVADAIELSASADFTGSQVLPVPPGASSAVDYTLPTIGANGEKLTIHHRPRTGGSAGPAASLQLTGRFSPSVSPLSGQRFSSLQSANVAVDTLLRFEAVGRGITALELVDPDSNVVAVADPFAPIEILLPPDSSGPRSWQFVFVGDLGVRVAQTQTLTPSTTLGEASVQVVGGAGTTSEDEVRLKLACDGAGQVVLSEAVDFSGATWQAFADTVSFSLSPGAGEKTVYAAFRSPFSDARPTASVDITRLDPPAGARSGAAGVRPTDPRRNP